jgi:hypothetical protein
MCFTFVDLTLYAQIYKNTSNTELATGFFFFFTMEFLQFIQYLFIASDLGTPECNTFVNQFLTLLGFIHICLQPYFCHVINGSLMTSCKYKDRFMVIKRLCLIGGFLLFLRYPMSFIPELNTMGISRTNKSTEWMRGDELCTFKSQSMWHLGWSVPMSDPSYLMMSASIHSFLMFAPFAALYEKDGIMLKFPGGLFLQVEECSFVVGCMFVGVLSHVLRLGRDLPFSSSARFRPLGSRTTSLSKQAFGVFSLLPR